MSRTWRYFADIMYFGTILILGIFPLLTCSNEDPCDKMDCPDTMKCFVYNPLNAGGNKRAVCVASSADSVILKSDNDHVVFDINCPPLQKVGLRYNVHRIDCGPYRADACANDFECSGNHICCYDGCVKNCTVPVLSRYSP